VYYTNSSGTINHLTVQNQSFEGTGIGVWLQGGSANPSVILENSNVLGFGSTGISIYTYSDMSALTATVKGNYVNTAPLNGPPYPIGINFLGGGTVYITDNLITGGFQGIGVADQDLTFAAGSVSANTVVNAAGLGIGTIPGGVSLTSNTIYNVPNGDGISVDSSVAPVTGNTIIAAGLGIEFFCTAGSNVHSNTIQGTLEGVWDVPLAAAANTYYDVGTIRGTEGAGGCQ
jgi:nitrous oxidase accessory protein NosD